MYGIRRSVAIRSLHRSTDRFVGRFVVVADKEVEVLRSTPALRRPGNKLSTPSRVTAYALGIASLGAGGVAVFTTHVEAGPVALLFVGLIFMIVALSGRLPTRLRIGDNEAEWQEYAGDIIETALDAAPRSTKAEIAPQLEELAEVAPRAAAPALSSLAYESNLAWSVSQAANKIPDVQRVKTWERVEDVGEFDFAIEATGDRVVLIEAKGSPRLSVSQVSEIMAKAHFYREMYPDRKVGLLLVTRYPLSAGIRATFMQTPNAACIVVRSREDRDALSAAINCLLSSLG